MRSKGSQHFIGLSNELMNCSQKFLYREHSVIASLLSLSIPGQNHLSCNLSCVWSQPKWLFCSWTFIVSLNPLSLVHILPLLPSPSPLFSSARAYHSGLQS